MIQKVKKKYCSLMAAEKDWGKGYLGSLGWVCTYTAISKTDNQQGPAV